MTRLQSLLEEGITAARHGDESHARLCFRQVLLDQASYAQQALAHFWLAQLTGDEAEKREHLETALALEPQNAQIRQMLAVLDGRLKPDAIVDADAFQPPDAPQRPRAWRFICPQCGARMQFDASGNSLVCDYCGHHMPVLRALQSGMNIAEQDFGVGLATATGHTAGDAPRAVKCQGCQAVLVSRQHSLTCPYCGSHHVVDVQSQAVAPPQVMILFGVAAQEARRALQTWVDAQVIGVHYQTSRVRGVYLPAWTFDIVTDRPWRVMHTESAPAPGALPSLVSYEGNESAFHDDVLIPATHLLPYALLPAFEDFALDKLTTYDDACLANHPAALHTLTLAEASLVARRKAYQVAEKQTPSVHSGSKFSDIKIAPPKVTVLSYKLALLPFWIGNYRYKGKVYLAVINGQNGKVRGEPPPGLLEKALGKVL